MTYENIPEFVKRQTGTTVSYVYDDLLVGFDGNKWEVTTDLITGLERLYLEFRFSLSDECGRGIRRITLPLPSVRPDAFGLAVILELARNKVDILV